MEPLYSYGGVRLISTQGVSRRFTIPERTLTYHAKNYGCYEVFGIRLRALQSTEGGTWGWIAALVEEAEREMQQWRDYSTD